jgi:hypothetical protein
MASPARCTAWIGISLTHGYLTSCPCFRRLHGRAGIVSSSAVPSNRGPHQDTTNFSAPRSRSAHEEFGAHYENHGPSSAQRHRISPPPRHAAASSAPANPTPQVGDKEASTLRSRRTGSSPASSSSSRSSTPAARANVSKPGARRMLTRTWIPFLKIQALSLFFHTGLPGRRRRNMDRAEQRASSRNQIYSIEFAIIM